MFELVALLFSGAALAFMAAQPAPGARALAYALWGMCTALFFAPMGLLLALVSVDHARIAALGAFSVSVLGFVTGVALIVHGIRLASGRPRRATEIGWLTVVHHALVLGVVGAALFEPTSEAILVIGALSLPCAIGAFLGYRVLTG